MSGSCWVLVFEMQLDQSTQNVLPKLVNIINTLQKDEDFCRLHDITSHEFEGTLAAFKRVTCLRRQDYCQVQYVHYYSSFPPLSWSRVEVSHRSAEANVD